MNSDALALFLEVVQNAVPYALTWRVGSWIVGTLLDMMTGRSDRL